MFGAGAGAGAGSGSAFARARFVASGPVGGSGRNSLASSVRTSSAKRRASRRPRAVSSRSDALVASASASRAASAFFSKKNVFRSASLARRSVSLARRSDRSSCSYCSSFVRDASRSFASRASAFPGSTTSPNESRSASPRSFFASAATRDALASAANDFVRYASAAFSASAIRALYVFAIDRAARASSCSRRSAGSRSSAEGSDPPNPESAALVSVALIARLRVCSFPETPLREGGREEA